ncbi:Rab11 family-interacting protein 1 [Armadillidium vulgare]|nr:Rab11 family-interacting protein 1 [Armadillidium vulgare]
MVNFTVKSGSFLDISKKDKQKSSLTSLKHLGGSLMSIGGKDKREGLKNFAKSVSSKMDKIAKPKRRKSKTPSENSSTGFSNDLMSSQQRYGDADPGVISDDDDDDFKFDDDVKVNTRTSSPLSTMSRGSSLMHEQVLDTDYEVGSYEDPEHDFSYSFGGKSSAKPPLIVDETKEFVPTTPDIGRQAITSQRVTSFSNPNPLVRITPSAPEIVQTIIEEEPSFDKTDHSDSESVDNVSPVSNRRDDFVDNDDEDQKLGSIDLGPPIELPNRVSRTQDYPSPVSISDEVVDVKTRKDPIPSIKNKEADISRSSIELSSRIFGKQENLPLISTSDKIVDINIMEDSVSPVKNNETLNSHTSTYFSPTDIAHVNNQNKQKKITEGHKYTFEVSNSAGYIELETAKSDVVENNEIPLSAAVEKDFEKMYSKPSTPPQKDFEKMYSKHSTSAEKDLEKMYSKHSTPAEKDFEKMYSKHSTSAEKDFEKMYITGSVDNVSMTGSRSSLNTSRESSIHDVKKGDSFTRLPEVKALTLEKISITEEEDGKKQKRKQKTGFKNRFFSKPENRDRPNEDSRIVEGGNDRLPSIPSRPSKLPQEIHDKFAGKSREDLLEIILNLQSTLEKQVKHSSELEEYIDNLLLRVMEATPHILQAPITTGSSIKT